MQITALQNHPKADELPPERLAGNKLLSEQEKIHEASRQFEAMLLRQILETTQKPVIKSKFSDNSTAGSVYRDMVTSQLAESISKSGGFGLAKTFEQQLEPSKHQHSSLGETTNSKISSPLEGAAVHPKLESPKGAEITKS